jgi:hypothetical protein
MNRSLVTVVCLGLALVAAPAGAGDETDLSRRVTIDVTEVAPGQVMALLARAVGCSFAEGSDSDPLRPIRKLLGAEQKCRFFVDPALTQPLTLHLVNVRVDSVLPVICQSISCEYRFDGTNVWLKPLSESRRRQTAAREAHFRKLESTLPQGMRFEGAALADVLQAIGAASGLFLEPWKGEGEKKVTVDVSGRTVNEALEAVVSRIEGEGVVMIRSWDGSMAQYRVVDRRR